MAFERPLLRDIVSRVEGDVEARLPGTNARLQINLLNVLSRMLAGASHELYGAIAWLAENMLPDGRDEDIFRVWAGIYRVERLAATPAVGSVEFSGAGAIPNGTLLVSEAGVRYQTTVESIAPGEVSVEALQVGAGGNVLQGELTLLSPLAGVASKALIGADGVVGGAEQESLSAWQSRLLQRLQNPPRGGSASDYERWAREAHPAVTHAWVSSHEEGIIGLVRVRVASYGDAAGDFPVEGGQLLTTVKDYIDSQRSVGGLLQVVSPVAQAVNMTIALEPLLQSVKDSVSESLQQLFYDETYPAYIDVTTNEMTGELLLSRVMQAIGLTPGVEDYQLLSIDPLKPNEAGKILTLGAIEFEEI